MKIRKIGKFVIGGLETKIFNLCILLVVVAITAFALIGISQINTLSEVTRKSDEEQTEVIKKRSGSTVREITERGLIRSARLGANAIDREFWTFWHDYHILAKQIEDVFRNPDDYKERDIQKPDKKNKGKISAQLMYPDTLHEPDEQTISMVRKLAGLTPMMGEIIEGNTSFTVDCIIALPDGTSIIVDAMADQKYEGDSLMDYDPRTREWYKGAVKTKELYFTPVVHSFFYDFNEVVFGLPIYMDGELKAVLEGCIKVDTLHEMVEEAIIEKTGFSFIVSNSGQLVYSPREDGELGMDEKSLSRDIRSTDNEQLNDLIKAGLRGETGFVALDIDKEKYHVAYAPMKTVGWTLMIAVSDAELSEPTDILLSEVDDATKKIRQEYRKSFRSSSGITLIVMILLVINAIIVAIYFSRKILKPINLMTKKVSEISADNMVFELENEYMTGDEIEVLAKAFGDLSEQSRGYIAEIVHISAEKERIATELNVAAKIQADMLPAEFPMFPDRDEFELYASMDPAKEVGGDFYDVFLADDDHLAIVMGDVSDKGVPAALFMVIAQTLIRTRAQMGGDPGQILTDVNSKLKEKSRHNMFVTVWLAIITISTGEVIEANAGHENPVIRRNGGSFEFLKLPHDMVVGVIDGLVYKTDTFKLSPGDTIFIYTDGVPEATDKDEECFGEDRMLETLNRAIDITPRELLRTVRAGVDAFVGDAPQFDDLTMLAIRYLGTDGSKHKKEDDEDA